MLTAGAGQAQIQLDPDCKNLQFTLEVLPEENITRLTGQVEITCGTWQFYADQVDFHNASSELVASGNVVFRSAGSQINADRVTFNTEELTGTFENASGSIALGEEVERSMFGTQEPDMLFYGETIEKRGPRTYRITRGGFTSCIQPTPRWELTASSVTLNLDDYALLKNSVLEVKGVPLFYLPVLYYPIQQDDRATGFLLPTYGVSTIRGQSISNAFFWAINRSHDATFFHDWFSSRGQGAGAEYRYILAQGSEGYARTYLLNEREMSAPQATGGKTTTIKTPGRRSYEVRGSVTQRFNRAVSARGQANYFSDVTVQQSYYTDIYQASSRQRAVGGNVTGAWGGYTLSGTFDRNETFFGARYATLTGAGPRISLGQSERLIPATPVYYAFGIDYAHLLQRTDQGTQRFDSGLHRLDIHPGVRFPFTRWQFLTVNSAASWRGTYWSERIDPRSRRQVEQGVSRGYFAFEAQITGPTLVKVWDSTGGYAERFKHVIEPSFTLQRLTAIDNFNQIVRIDSLDSIVGGLTQIRYGVTNRIYAKRAEGKATATASEILGIAVVQSYYTDERAAQVDPAFRSSFYGTPPSHFSPISLSVRAEPTPQISGSLRTEYDINVGALRTIGAEGGVAVGGWLDARAGWSQRRFIKSLPGFDDPRRLDHYLNTFTGLRSRGNRTGGLYSMHYDLTRNRFLQQRWVGYYNAQCCGFGVEYQSFNFLGLGTRALASQDRRFTVSFTLAGLGTFSNQFGIFGAGLVQ